MQIKWMSHEAAIEYLGGGYTIGVGYIFKTYGGMIIEEHPIRRDLDGTRFVLVEVKNDAPPRKELTIEISGRTGSGKTRAAHAIAMFLTKYNFDVDNQDIDARWSSLPYKLDGNDTKMIIKTKQFHRVS